MQLILKMLTLICSVALIGSCLVPSWMVEPKVSKTRNFSGDFTIDMPPLYYVLEETIGYENFKSQMVAATSISLEQRFLMQDKLLSFVAKEYIDLHELLRGRCIGEEYKVLNYGGDNESGRGSVLTECAIGIDERYK